MTSWSRQSWQSLVLVCIHKPFFYFLKYRVWVSLEQRIFTVFLTMLSWKKHREAEQNIFQPSSFSEFSTVFRTETSQDISAVLRSARSAATCQGFRCPRARAVYLQTVTLWQPWQWKPTTMLHPFTNASHFPTGIARLDSWGTTGVKSTSWWSTWLGTHYQFTVALW